MGKKLVLYVLLTGEVRPITERVVSDLLGSLFRPSVNVRVVDGEDHEHGCKHSHARVDNVECRQDQRIAHKSHFLRKKSMLNDRDRAFFWRNTLHAPMFQSKVGQGFKPRPLLKPAQ